MSQRAPAQPPDWKGWQGTPEDWRALRAYYGDLYLHRAYLAASPFLVALLLLGLL